MAEPVRKSALRENVEAIFWAFTLFLAMRTGVAEAFRIPSESMQNTLLVGDFLFVQKLEYGGAIPFTHSRLPGLRAPAEGDVIVFRYPPDPSLNYIKRVVATAGQTVEVRHKRLYVDGRTPHEPWIRHGDPAELPAEIAPRDNMPPYVVPPGHLFVMGDNRDHSADSRFWGPVPLENVVGRACFTYFSTSGDAWWNAPLRMRPGRMFRPIR